MRTSLMAGPRPLASVSVKSYGAVGDGVTDDTAALNAAQVAAAGAMLLIDPGTYKTTGLTINGPVKVIGSGTIQGKLTIGAAVEIQEITVTQAGIAASGVNNITLTDVKVLNTTGPGVAIVTADNLQIIDCTVDGTTAQGLNLTSITNSKVLGTTIQNCDATGITLWGGDADWRKPIFNATCGVDTVEVGNCTVTNVGRTFATAGLGGGGIFTSMGQNVTVHDCNVTTCGDVGIDFEGGNHNTASWNFVTNAVHGCYTVFYRGTFHTFDQNHATQASGFNNGVKIFGVGTCTNISITNNTIVTHESDGILALAGTLDRSIVTGNDIDITTGQGVNIPDGTNTISGNTVH